MRTGARGGFNEFTISLVSVSFTATCSFGFMALFDCGTGADRRPYGEVGVEATNEKTLRERFRFPRRQECLPLAHDPLPPFCRNSRADRKKMTYSRISSACKSLSPAH
jgi:hypothetical protein